MGYVKLFSYMLLLAQQKKKKKNKNAYLHVDGLQCNAVYYTQ